jgi:hypothetical protein
MASEDLKEKVTGSIRTPIDGIGKLEIKIEVGGKIETLKVDEKFLQSERQEIEEALTHVMPKRGRIILRADRGAFDYHVERFIEIVTAYQQAVSQQIEGERSSFQKSFVDEFLSRWTTSPPERLKRRWKEPRKEQLARSNRG